LPAATFASSIDAKGNSAMNCSGVSEYAIDVCSVSCFDD
jgi:hypothetical protein